MHHIIYWIELHRQKSILISFFGLSIGELINRVNTWHVPPIYMEVAEFVSRLIGSGVGAITIITFIISLFKKKKNTDEVQR